MKLSFLGGLTAQQFLKEYWQKKPLFVRGAFPEFTGLLSPDELAGLACMEEAESRLVQNKGNKWSLRRGPFSDDDFTKLPKKSWTLLVQGVNQFLPEGTALMDRFDFIPRARLDDLMVSYAPQGGSVGPHFDPYDVFLIQGIGHRRWQISTQEDQRLLPDAPHRVLLDFKPEQEWITEMGDLLYLPPQCGHYGLAMDECMTYSVGFQAPYAQELASQFLMFMQDEIRFDGIYQDPDLKTQSHPSEISKDMIAKVSRILSGIKWGEKTVSRFLGTYLTEPKVGVVFNPPKRPLTMEKFRQRVQETGLSLALTSTMLFHKSHFYLNGEKLAVSKENQSTLRNFADTRRLPGKGMADSLENQLYQWYRAGYIVLGEPS
jgi:50S ribosomal protein L16 3-hydroxylase